MVSYSVLVRGGRGKALRKGLFFRREPVRAIPYLPIYHFQESMAPMGSTKNPGVEKMMGSQRNTTEVDRIPRELEFPKPTFAT